MHVNSVDLTLISIATDLIKEHAPGYEYAVTLCSDIIMHQPPTFCVHNLEIVSLVFNSPVTAA